ncbi:MAG: HipA domain-containing protein [Rhodocyclaceae bacterium]|nr:HipA domain-containing protein [Rhodocyclaceae bacterium]
MRRAHRRAPHRSRAIDGRPGRSAARCHRLECPAALSDEDALRISIAGAQEKTALLHHEGRWCHPLGSTPTTHILKLPVGEPGRMRADFSRSVENAWLCARIARAFGLDVAQCEMLRFGRHKALCVARFDRIPLEGWLARRPQEDLCQALGVPADRKYQEHGGPGMADILSLLPGSQFRRTPLYDIMSTCPIIGSGARQLPWQRVKLATALRSRNDAYRMYDIQRRHWRATASKNALGPDLEPLIDDFVRRAPAVVEAVQRTLPDGFPPAASDPIFQGLQTQAGRLAAGPLPGTE